MKVTSEVRKPKTKSGKDGKEFELPDSTIISEWFSQDQEKKIRKLTDPTNYDKYSVYQVYSEHSKTM